MNVDQHFLVDESIAKQMVSLCDIKKQDVVIEIGGGNGEITRFIPECRLTVIEKDKQLAGKLKQKFPDAKIITGDGVSAIKKIDFDYLISSVPYSICEPLFRELFLHDFRKAVLIFPKTLVDNLENKETSLSFLANEFFDIKKIRDIGREKFEPMPNVDSVLVELTQNKTGDKILKSIYLQQDKKLKNALREAIVEALGKTKKQANEMIKGMKITDKTINKNVRMLSYHELKYVKDTTLKLLQ